MKYFLAGVVIVLAWNFFKWENRKSQRAISEAYYQSLPSATEELERLYVAKRADEMNARSLAASGVRQFRDYHYPDYARYMNSRGLETSQQKHERLNLELKEEYKERLRVAKERADFREDVLFTVLVSGVGLLIIAQIILAQVKKTNS